MCDRKEQLVGFLYGELDVSETHAFRQHLAACTECRGELADLRATRGQIAAWTPPEPDLGFHLVRGAAAPPPPPPARVFRIAPAWGLAAAAILVMAIGAAIANLEVRLGSGEGLVIRTGWSRGAATGAAAPSAETGAQPVDWKQQALQLDQRLRDVEQVLARDRAASIQNAAASGVSDAELQQVRDMIGRSETRQQRILAARLADVTRDFNAQRRIDLAAIDQGFMRLQNTSGAEARQARELVQRMNRVMSTSLQTK
jgi:anti-sigma factor RsiW